jgi:hypothetical protein
MTQHNAPRKRKTPKPITPEEPTWDYWWASKTRHPERRLQFCRILVARRGKFLIEFQDRHLVTTARGTFRKRPRPPE